MVAVLADTSATKRLTGHNYAKLQAFAALHICMEQ